MVKVALIFCAFVAVVLADPERPRNYLEHDATVINCARYAREANQHSCVLAPFNTEGPYFLPDDWERSDITDGLVGVPLDLTLNLVNSNDCNPLAGMFVHVWHSSPTGGYSGVGGIGGGDQGGQQGGFPGGQQGGQQGGFPGGQQGGMGGFPDQGGFGGQQGFGGQSGFGNQGGFGGQQQGFGGQFGQQGGMGNMGGQQGGQQGGMNNMGGQQGGQQGGQGGQGGEGFGRPTPINDERYLRGYQVTNSDGSVNFKTILPGWYDGRSLHIHVEVYASNTTESSDISFVGQIFFSDDLPSMLQLIDPYSTNHNQITLNANDNVFWNRGEETLVTLVPIDGSGYKTSLTLGVNPEGRTRG